MTEKAIPAPMRPLMHRCDTFIGEKDGIYESTTIIVVPIKLSAYSNYWIIKWSCSKGRKCFNKHCIYSRVNSGRREENEP